MMTKMVHQLRRSPRNREFHEINEASNVCRELYSQPDISAVRISYFCLEAR